jgi:hypothetical protein
MENEPDRVGEDLKNKPGSSSVIKQPESVFEGFVVKAEFSKVQLFYVILFTPGLFFFGLYILSFLIKPMPKSDFWTTLIIAAVGILFVLLGIAFPFLMRLGRRKVARSFSAEGVEIWNGKIIPWTQVNSIAAGYQNINDSSFRKLDITFRDNSSVYVSSYWVVNFEEIEEYLVQMPQYCP